MDLHVLPFVAVGSIDVFIVVEVDTAGAAVMQGRLGHLGLGDLRDVLARLALLALGEPETTTVGPLTVQLTAGTA